MKPEHGKKMVAPAVIAGIFILYFFVFLVLCLCVPMPAGLKLLFAVVPLAFMGVTIFVLWERIQEIRSGEEDDLSKY